jgi:hypothetical protein
VKAVLANQIASFSWIKNNVDYLDYFVIHENFS